jgi:hypothetical protein
MLHLYLKKWDEIVIGPDERPKTLDEWRGGIFLKKNGHAPEKKISRQRKFVWLYLRIQRTFGPNVFV